MAVCTVSLHCSNDSADGEKSIDFFKSHVKFGSSISLSTIAPKLQSNLFDA